MISSSASSPQQQIQITSSSSSNKQDHQPHHLSTAAAAVSPFSSSASITSPPQAAAASTAPGGAEGSSSSSPAAAATTTTISVSLEAIKAALLSKTPHPLQSLEGYRRASIAAPEFHSAVAPGLPFPFSLGQQFATESAQQQQQHIGGISGNHPGGVSWKVENPFGGIPQVSTAAAAQAQAAPVAPLGLGPGVPTTSSIPSAGQQHIPGLFGEIPSTFSTTNIGTGIGATGTVSALIDPIDYSQLSKELFSFSPAQDLRPLPSITSSGAAAAAAAVAGTGAGLGVQQQLQQHSAPDLRRPSIATAASELTLSDFSPLTPLDTLEQPPPPSSLNHNQQQRSLKGGSTGSSNLSSSNLSICPSTGGTATTAELELTGSPLTPLSAALSLFGGDGAGSPAAAAAGQVSRSVGVGFSGEATGGALEPSPFANSDWSFDGAKHQQQQQGLTIVGDDEGKDDTEMSPMVTKANGMGAAGSPHAGAGADVGTSPAGRSKHQLSGFANGGGGGGHASAAPGVADAARAASSANGFFSDPFASNAASTAAAAAAAAVASGSSAGRAHELSHDGSALGSTFSSGGPGDDERVSAAGASAGPAAYNPHSAGTSGTAASFSGPSYGSSAHHQYMPAHILHRASISGPIMQHHHGFAGAVPGGHGAVGGHAGMGDAGQAAAAPTMSAAPPSAGDMAAWAHAHGGARPHTADGFYGPFGFNTGGFSHAASTAGSLTPTNTADDGGFARNDGSHSHFLFNYVASHGNVGDNQLRSPDEGAGDASFASGASGANARDGDDDDDAGSGGGAGNSSGLGPHKKRPRRRYDEVERLYACNYQGCPKSYGTLNHLNAHVAMQKHGQKRLPSEFKDMRKAWRKAKREDEQRRMAAAQQTVNAHAAMAAAALDRQRVNSHPGLMHGSMPPPALPHYGPHAGMSYAAPSQAMPSANPAQAAAFARALPMPAAAQHGYAPYQMSHGGAPLTTAEYEYRYNVPPVPGGLGAYLMQGHHHRGSI